MNCTREKVNKANAVVRTYSWGPEAQGEPGTLRMITDSNGVYFPAYDPNGNVMGLVKASDGTVCAQYEYLPYGEQVTATGTMAGSNPIRFSTKYRDNETGLYYYGYRYYSSDMGRWLSRDPIEEQGGLNLYAFVNNDPVNYWDLRGMTDYKIGDDYPPYEYDETNKGSGDWASISLPVLMEIPYFLAIGRVHYIISLTSPVLPDASAHFRHFLDNSATPYTIRLDKMLKVGDEYEKVYLKELAEAKKFVDSIKNPPGCRFSITSQKMRRGSIEREEDINWYLAVHEYRVWGRGIVEVCENNQYRLYFNYQFRDPYDWQTGQTFFKFIRSDDLQFLHRIGVAQEFMMEGYVDEIIEWKKNEIRYNYIWKNY